MWTGCTPNPVCDINKAATLCAVDTRGPCVDHNAPFSRSHNVLGTNLFPLHIQQRGQHVVTRNKALSGLL